MPAVKIIHKNNKEPHAGLMFNNDIETYAAMSDYLAKDPSLSETMVTSIMVATECRCALNKPVLKKIADAMAAGVFLSKEYWDTYIDKTPNYVSWTIFNNHLTLHGYNRSMLHYRRNIHERIEAHMGHPFSGYVTGKLNKYPSPAQQKIIKELDDLKLLTKSN